MYSFSDVIRLRVARELRDQKVSLQTLRSILTKLGKSGLDLAQSRYVVVTRKVEATRTAAKLVALLNQRDRASFGVVIDLRPVLKAVNERKLALMDGD